MKTGFGNNNYTGSIILSLANIVLLHGELSEANELGTIIDGNLTDIDSKNFENKLNASTDINMENLRTIENITNTIANPQPAPHP